MDLSGLNKEQIKAVLEPDEIIAKKQSKRNKANIYLLNFRNFIIKTSNTISINEYIASQLA